MNIVFFEKTIYLISNAFRIIIMLRYAHCVFLPRRKHNPYEYISYLGYYALNSLVYLSFHSTLLNLATNIIPFFLLTYYCYAKNTVRILYTGLVYAISMILDSILYAIVQYININSVFVSSGAGTALLVFIFVMIFEHFQKDKVDAEFRLIHIVPVFIIPIGSILIGMFTMQANQFTEAPNFIVVECILLLLMNGMMFAVYDLIRQTYRQSIEKIVLENQNRAYCQQMKIMESSQNKVNFLKHDIKTHLKQIYIYAQRKECDNIMQYVNDTFSALNTDGLLVESNNTVVDSILNLKLSEASESGAEIYTEIKIPKELNIHQFDFNIILGNLLDNSIAAIRHTEKKIIYVKIEYNAGILCIVVRNTYGINPHLDSSCSDLHHGLGQKSIQSVVEKYNGDFSVLKEEMVYSAKIILFV